jgi:carboxypeptidase Taq
MTDSASAVYDQLCHHFREAAMLTSVESLLGWDERCLMPPAGGEYRADQMTMLSGMIHERVTDARIEEWLQILADSPLARDPASDAGTTIRQVRRQYDKKVKLPKSLVEELTRTSVLGQQAWQEARHTNDFARFEPLLTKQVYLKQQQAEALGYKECPYDALLDDYEPGELTSNVRRVLNELRLELVPLVAELVASPRKAPVEIVQRHFPQPAQEAFGKQVAAKAGFEFERGRLDVTAHPFCSGGGPHDCRITTRYDEQFFNSAFFGILHEAGHGIYEQGLRADQYGLPPGEAVSLGIHESQSRLWENLVGRSRPFWKFFYGDAQRYFPAALGNVAPDDFYFAINDVRPSLIRVEADEATYNLHILVRFELEQDLIHDNLKVADLPAAWNEKYRDYLGITPPDFAQGVLQDIHWSAGLIGYFATYSLGNLYASQFFAKANADLGDLSGQFARGEFLPLREWLRTNIHEAGQRYTAAELVESVTGSKLTPAPLMAHLRAKFGSLYGLT